MKKWIFIAVSLIFLFLVAVYLFIPDKIVVARSIEANVNQKGAYRSVADFANWQHWWPDSISTKNGGDTLFESGGFRFNKPIPGYDRLSIVLEKDKGADSSFLHIFSTGNESLRIEWSASVSTGSNPFNKWRLYQKAKQLGKTLEKILTAMQKHISDVKNLYGLTIKKEKVHTDFLVSMNNSFNRYPTTADIYDMITKIKKYIGQEHAREEDYPMLHIKVLDSTHFEAQVAIPVDKALPETPVFSLKRMLKNGNIIVAEVSGGKANTDQAMKQLDLYISDHKYYNVALPFLSLVTDRMNESDTSKWVTRIYYPIL